MKKVLNRLLCGIALTATATVACGDDIPGGKDFPDLPRVKGTSIIAQDHAEYDLGLFVESADQQSLALSEPEGERTRILYLAAEGQTPLLIQKNYQAALPNLGEVETLYQCRASQCPGKLPQTLWNKSNWLETKNLPYPQYLYNNSNFRTPSYWYGRVTRGDTLYHVSIFTAMITSNSPNPIARSRALIHLQITEVTDFEATLEFVDAAEMQSELTQKGHIALYGILFDHDSATLKPESQPTLAEISRALQESADLSLYVVGHTDDQGTLHYNRKLSMQRAESVISALTRNYGISSQRLSAIGVGPVAPVASNSSEDGRQLNRRVELVRR